MQQKANLHMFNEPPSKEVLDEIQLQKHIDVKTQF